MVRSAKKPRDENAPKCPLSGLFFWTGENRASYMEKNPDSSVAEIGKAMGKAWGYLSDAAKKLYIAAAEKAKEVYQKYMKSAKEVYQKYMKSGIYRKHQEAVAEWKKKEAKKPFHKDPNRPSRPTSAYMFFVNAERSALMKAGMGVTEVANAAAEKWGTMSICEKEKWYKKSASLKSKYEKEIAAYEKSGKHKSYMAEKEKYNGELDAKRKRSASASAGLTDSALSAQPEEISHGLQCFMEVLLILSSKEHSFGSTMTSEDVMRRYAEHSFRSTMTSVFDVMREVKDLAERYNCKSRVFVAKLHRDEDGNVVQNEFVSRTNEHHGSISLTVDADMVGKIHMAYIWFVEGKPPKLCTIPLLKRNVHRTNPDGTKHMFVPFQVVDLKTAEPVEVAAHKEAVWIMFTSEVRKCKKSDILVTLNPDKTINITSNVRLIELMRNHRNACLKKHKDFDAKHLRNASFHYLEMIGISVIGSLHEKKAHYDDYDADDENSGVSNRSE